MDAEIARNHSGAGQIVLDANQTGYGIVGDDLSSSVPKIDVVTLVAADEPAT